MSDVACAANTDTADHARTLMESLKRHSNRTPKTGPVAKPLFDRDFTELYGVWQARMADLIIAISSVGRRS